jgi:hypothetical protein
MAPKANKPDFYLPLASAEEARKKDGRRRRVLDFDCKPF